MKVPINWLKEYVKVPQNLGDLTHQLTAVGHMLDGVSDGVTGKVIDLELRGNRADCYSILGIAREVSAIYKTKISSPQIKTNLKKSGQLKNVHLSVKSPHVNRVVMGIIKDVKITSSPDWLKKRLKDYGVDSINNLVDLTNYVAIEMGEPMHAFDLQKIGKRLVIRQAKKKEKMVTFQDKTLTLTEDDLVWANEKNALSVAGAIGGKNHSISQVTKNILIEAANYDRANIRRSVHRHNLFTEAGIRHEKDLDPNMVELGISRFLYLVEKNGWGRVSNQISDYYPKITKPWELTLIYDNLNRLGGIDVPLKSVKEVLKRLSFEILSENRESLKVLAPTHRTDVREEADLIEEILRIYGYDKIPTPILSREIPNNVTPPFIDQELKIKNQLEGLGFDEMISSSFVSEGYLRLNLAQEVKSTSLGLQNPPSPDLAEMRLTLLPNLIEVSKKAINERADTVHYFEIGKVYGKIQRSYSEKRKIGLAHFDRTGAKFGKFKGFLEAFFKLNNINTRYKTSDDYTWLENPFEITSKKTHIGFGGVYDDIYFAELDLENILKLSRPTGVGLWPKYPPQIEDITFRFPDKTRIGDVLNTIRSIKYVSEARLTTIYKDAFTFRVWYQNPEKTLTNEEVGEIRTKVESEVEKKFGASVS